MYRPDYRRLQKFSRAGSWLAERRLAGPLWGPFVVHLCPGWPARNFWSSIDGLIQLNSYPQTKRP